MDSTLISKKFLDLDHKLLKSLKRQNINGATVAVAHSGGVDSTALFALFLRLKGPLDLKLKCYHVHHGLIKNHKQLRFRDNAFQLVQEQCQIFKIPLFCVTATKELKSELDYRGFREYAFDGWNREGDYMAFAHHQQDQLETRLMRLIRGCGSEGLQAMSFLDGSKLRPLLNEKKSDLITYCKDLKLNWVEDPSNNSSDYLRNWIRNEWLPQLERTSLGGVNRLHNSLAAVAESLASMSLPEALFADDKSLNLEEFLNLNEAQKKQALAQFMKMNQMKNYSQNHINEVLKRLDTAKNRDTFILLRCSWVVNAGRIRVLPKG